MNQDDEILWVLRGFKQSFARFKCYNTGLYRETYREMGKKIGKEIGYPLVVRKSF